MMKRRSGLLVPVLACALAACGTTVPGGPAMSSGAGDGLSVPSSVTAAEVPGAVADAGTSTDGITTPGPGAVGSDGGGGTVGAGSVGTAAPGAATQPGRGATADRTAVRVGVLYLDGAERAAGTLGISGLSTGDAMAQAKAVAAHLNATGGLAGRRIDLREGRMDAARAVSDAEGTYAAACASLTEDEK